jgi:hypothetical protein
MWRQSIQKLQKFNFRVGVELQRGFSTGSQGEPPRQGFGRLFGRPFMGRSDGKRTERRKEVQGRHFLPEPPILTVR